MMKKHGFITSVFGVIVLLCSFSLGVPAVHAAASNIYIAQSATGNANGADCADAYAYTFFNAAGNWGGGSNQIGPGTTVHICGTITGAAGQDGLTFHGGGTSGSPITLLFEPNAVMTSPAWGNVNGGDAAIVCSSDSYIVVDGGANGVIQNTANGTSLANHQYSSGVVGTNCPYSEVRNLTVKNIYINQGSSSGATDVAGASTQGIMFSGNSTAESIHNNTLSQMKSGIIVSADPNADSSNLQIYGNNINDMDWGINVGGGDAGDIADNISIHDNTITNWTNWQFPTNAYHQDGIILFNYATGSKTLTATLYNNYIYGDLGVGSPTGFIYCAQNASCVIYNNLLVNTGHLIEGILWLTTHLSNTKVYNNTIISNSNDIAITLGNTPGTNVNSPDIIENNIAIGVNVGIHDYLALASDVSLSDHNVWRTGSGSAVQMATNDSTYMTYATWQGYGFDAHSVTTNPNLSSSYIPQSGSSAIGLGANLTSLGIAALDFDKAGTARPASGAWDAGAYYVGGSGGGGDTTPPSVLISSPGNGATVSGAATISGTASDNVAVASVALSIDGGAYTAAAGTTSWSYSWNTTGVSNGNHAITTKATDTSGNTNTTSITVTVSNAATPPSTPTGLAVVGTTTSTIALSWNPSVAGTYAISGYKIYRNGSQVGTPASASFTDTGLAASTTYSYTVAAYDTNGNTSAQSGSVNAKTQPASLPPGCFLAGSSWVDASFSTQSNNQFTVSFDATPQGANIDGVTGISTNPAAAYADMAAIIRFNNTGTIDVMNSSAYQAQNTVAYSAGTSYHFVFTVNTPAKTYSVTVTPQGGAVTTLATNYAFRNTQAAATAFSYIDTIDTAGSHTICNLAVNALFTDSQPPSVSVSFPANNATVSSTISISGTASDNVAVASVALSIDGGAYTAVAGTTSWSYSWNTKSVSNSTHTITAKATDTSGNTAVSGITSVTVANTVSTSTPTSTPTISSFSASPGTITQGQASTLSWAVSGNPAPVLAVSPTIGQTSGSSVSVSPSQTTTYTLTAQSSAGTASAQVTVTVNALSSGGGSGSSGGGGGGSSGGGGGGGSSGSGSSGSGSGSGSGSSGSSSGIGTGSSSTSTTPISSLPTSVSDLETLLQSLLAELEALIGQLNTQLVQSFTRTLTIGSSGQDVTNLQVFLNDNGYSVAETGAGSPGNEVSYFGAKTAQALAKWQSANGITPASGILGPKTRAYMQEKW